ncbi:hypothetical protein [Marinobacter sp. ELB17]|uniref:hypothetical protein n=1 Tax=Marinobacter sp. ELB17 TaxID=270374 RepID=UPI001D0D5EA6|nr:hypothetical protein [Marinobacter sp. ELB17]
MEGGCALLAESLQWLIPDSQLMVVGRIDEGVSDHVLMIREDGEAIYIDYDGLQFEHELIEKMRQECLSDCIGIAPAKTFLFTDSDLFWLQDDVLGFSGFLESKMGSVDADRVSLTWLDGADCGPGPA